MADNRMYIRHKGTGKSLLLAKYFGVWSVRSMIVDSLAEFLAQATEETLRNGIPMNPDIGLTDFELSFENTYTELK